MIRLSVLCLVFTEKLLSEEVRVLGRGFRSEATEKSKREATGDACDGKGGGMGYGIVHMQHIPSLESENLYRHVASPKTVSVIG
jgi:hypothetical protein